MTKEFGSCVKKCIFEMGFPIPKPSQKSIIWIKVFKTDMEEEKTKEI